MPAASPAATRQGSPSRRRRKGRRGRPQRPSLWRRFTVRLITTVVLAVLVGAGWVLFQPSGDQPLTSDGAPVANAAQLLRSAESAMHRAVATRHGNLGKGARCYFNQPHRLAAGGSAADAPQPIGDRVFCGPLLFVDGDPARPFLTFGLTPMAQPNGTVRLSLGSQDGDGTAADPRPAERLFRPDGTQPPASDQVASPRPPPAVGDVLTTTSTLPSPLTPAPANAIMIGQVSGVRLVEYGFVDSYGWAESARTAPAGYRLLAFATDPRPGEEGNQPPDLSVRVDGQERGPLTTTADYVVTAVPKRATQVELVLTDGGVKQAISLLTGQPDAANPAVTVRRHDQLTVGTAHPVRVRLQTAAGTGTLSGTFTLKSLSLSYWAANGDQCPRPDGAWLHLGALLRLDGDPQAYGVESSLLTVTVPGGGALHARNAAADPVTGVDDVVQVPASVTAGSVTLSGSVRTAKGTLTVLTPITLPFSIPAG
ncbi:MAG TPA: hypothetical protein VHO01_12605 [Jatrophihabitans sp.]|nr:hypothetical protein [Jatrophihabitans sp.]